MLSGLVPAADHQDESRRDTALKETLKCTEDNQMCEVLSWTLLVKSDRKMKILLTKPDAKYNNSPTDHITRQNLSHLVALQNDVARELEDHVNEICRLSDVLLHKLKLNIQKTVVSQLYC